MTNQLVKDQEDNSKNTMIGNLISYLFNSKQDKPIEVKEDSANDVGKEVKQAVVSSAYDVVYNSAAHLFGGNTKIFMGVLTGTVFAAKYVPFTMQIGNHNLHVGLMSGAALGGLVGYHSTAAQVEEIVEAEL